MNKIMKYVMVAGMLGGAGYGAYMYAKNNRAVMKKIKSMYNQVSN